MEIEQVLLDIIEKDIKHKFETLNNELEILIENLPGSADIDLSRKVIINTYFEPETEKENHEMVTYIVKHINLIIINYINIVSMIYTQMESLLFHKAKIIGKASECAKYSKKCNKMSIIESRFNFLVSENKYSLSEVDNFLIESITGLLRNERNGIAHNLYNVFTYEDAIELIGDGINLNQKLYSYQSYYIEKINALYFITESFFQLVEKI